MVASTPISEELIAEIVAAEPRIDFIRDQSLLAPQRFPGDHSGDPAFTRARGDHSGEFTDRRCREIEPQPQWPRGKQLLYDAAADTDRHYGDAIQDFLYNWLKPPA